MSSKPTAVSNSGPLIHLGKVVQLKLLPFLFELIQVPEKVYEEVVEREMENGAPDAL